MVFRRAYIFRRPVWLDRTFYQVSQCQKGSSVLSAVSGTAHLLFLPPAALATETRWRPRHISRGDQVSVEANVMDKMRRSAVYGLQGPRCRNKDRLHHVGCASVMLLDVGFGNALDWGRRCNFPSQASSAQIDLFARLDPLYVSFQSQCSSALRLSYCRHPADTISVSPHCDLNWQSDIGRGVISSF